MSPAVVHVETRRDGTTRPDRSIVLCGSQRVGSTLLCDLMTTTDRLGYPKEFFLPQARDAFLRAFGLPSGTAGQTFLDAALRNGTSPNGVFATKVMADQLDELGRSTGPAGWRALPSPTAVWLRRRDKVAVAVSQWRAEQTGRWSATARDGGEVGSAGARASTTDLQRITVLHRTAHEAEERWADVLAGDAAITADYEDWVTAPASLLARIAATIDVDLGGARPRSALVRQADDLNEEVARRWTQMTGGCDCRVDAAVAPVEAAKGLVALGWE